MDKKHLEELLTAAIVADLKNPEMTHAAISAKYRVGFNRITDVAKEYGLTRRRGTKLGRKSSEHIYTNLPVVE